MGEVQRLRRSDPVSPPDIPDELIDRLLRRLARYVADALPERPPAAAAAPKLLLTRAEAAERLSVDESTIDRLVDRGALTRVKLPTGGVRIRAREVALLADGEPGG